MMPQTLLPGVRRVVTCLITLGALLLLGLPAGAVERGALSAPLDSITAGELQTHVETLADDAWQGREAGSVGGHAAGQYLADLLHQYFIQPAGDADSYFQPFGNGYRNVLGWIEGRDPALQNEYVLVGAHYDHVGFGTRRNSLGTVGLIHNGADDNASGTAGILEVVQAFTMLPEPPRRSILFAFWDGEEKGMLGSRHWTGHPTRPLNKLVLGLNVDMIGRLRNDRLEVYGLRTAAGLRRLVCRQNRDTGLEFVFQNELRANGDHYAFYERNIPFVMFHTGLHDDYHRPSDDADKINADGIRRIARLMFGTVYEVAERDRSEPFRTAVRAESHANDAIRVLPSPPPRLGIRWDPGKTGRGITVSHVTSGGPADRAGIHTGDEILQIGGYPVADEQQFPLIVLAAPSHASVVLLRPGADAPVTVTVELPGDPLRVGISWRDDPAEPGIVVLTRVVTGSAAERAGLVPGDRIYEIEGQPFADPQQHHPALVDAAGPLRMLIEHNGRIRETVLDLLPPPPVAEPAPDPALP